MPLHGLRRTARVSKRTDEIAKAALAKAYEDSSDASSSQLVYMRMSFR